MDFVHLEDGKMDYYSNPLPLMHYNRNVITGHKSWNKTEWGKINNRKVLK
jgi:hypothetical protein